MHDTMKYLLISAGFALALPLGGNTGCATGGDKVDPNAPPDPGAMYEAAMQYKADGEESGKLDLNKLYDRLAAACDAGFAEDVNSPHVKACYNAGVAADRLGRPHDAVGHYKRALKVDPGFKPAVQNLTVALLRDGKATDALPIYEDYLAKNPGDEDMTNNYAGALGEAGMTDKGVEVLQGLLFEDPKNTRAYKTLAQLYFLGGNWRMSQMASANALKLDKEDADIHNNIGITFLAEGKEAEAVSAFKEALKLDEGNLEANMNLGLLAVGSADYELAAASFQKVLGEFPGNHEARVGLAVAYRGIAEFDTALEQYDTILAADSCNELALLNKAIVQHRFVAPAAGEITEVKKELEKASKTYRRLGECDSGNQAAADGLAAVTAGILEKEQELAEIAELERQLAELDAKAKAKTVELTATVQRADAVFTKYAEVEQDPSWLEVYMMQRDATVFAIEMEDFFFMEEQGAYLDEFMLQYYADALELASDEWTSGEAILMPEPEAPEGEGAPAEGDAGSEAPAEGAQGEAPATEEAPAEEAPAPEAPATTEEAPAAEETPAPE